MPHRYHPLETALVRGLRSGTPDAYGQPAERTRAVGAGNPCRHCLGFVPDGAPMLILAHRPFPEPQPYAETGPIFLCGDDCTGWTGTGLPPVLTASPDYLIKGYSADHRIVYGTGRVTPQGALDAYVTELLNRPEIAFVDLRSARNNCFLTRALRVA